ncbi:MAG: hypothetical protein ACKVZJ_14680 [Phycisphaerales bacterium]
MYETTVREMTEAERAEALALARKAGADAFPVWWRRVLYAVIAFGVIKAASLLCCVPSVGGMLAMFGVRNLWVELVLLAVSAGVIGWGVAAVQRQSRRASTELFVKVTDDLNEARVKETRWHADRAWRARVIDFDAAIPSIVCRIAPDSFAVIAAGERMGDGRAFMQGPSVASSGCLVTLPRSGLALRESCRVDRWNVARLAAVELELPDEIDLVWRVELAELDEPSRAHLLAEIEVREELPPENPRPVEAARKAVGRSVLMVAAWVLGLSAASAFFGMLAGLLFGSGWGDAARAAVMSVITVAVLAGVIASAVGLARAVFWADALMNNGATSSSAPREDPRMLWCWSETFDAERCELLRRREGGPIVAAAWHTQGLVYLAPVAVLDHAVMEGRCGRRVTMVFSERGERRRVEGVRHEGPAIECGSRCEKWWKLSESDLVWRDGAITQDQYESMWRASTASESVSQSFKMTRNTARKQG